MNISVGCVQLRKRLLRVRYTCTHRKCLADTCRRSRCIRKKIPELSSCVGRASPSRNHEAHYRASVDVDPHLTRVCRTLVCSVQHPRHQRSHHHLRNDQEGSYLSRGAGDGALEKGLHRANVVSIYLKVPWVVNACAEKMDGVDGRGASRSCADGHSLAPLAPLAPQGRYRTDDGHSVRSTPSSQY